MQVWGAAEINLGYELSEDHKRVLLLVLKVGFNLCLGSTTHELESHRKWSDSTHLEFFVFRDVLFDTDSFTLEIFPRACREENDVPRLHAG